MLLIELFKNIQIEGKLDKREITSIAYNSKKIKPGALFIAIKGHKINGENYINEAIDNGAVAILSTQIKDVNKNVLMLKVDNPRETMSKIAANFYKNPSIDMNIIGVTGTNGKTSITSIIHHILSELNIACSTLGTLGFKSPSGIRSTNFTTPESIDLQQMLHTLNTGNIKNMVMEISSHSLELHRVDNLDVDIAIYSNLSPEHLDFHGNINSYFKSKLKLFKKLKSSNIAVINIDDSYSNQIINNTDAKIISYGMNKNADIYPIEHSFSLNGTKCKLIYKNEIINIKTNLIGEYNLYNIMASICACLSLNIDLNTIKRVFENKIIIPGRLEEVPSSSEGRVFIDYAHTPDAYLNLFKTIKSICSKNIKLYTIFGCGGERDINNRAKIAGIVEKYSNYTIVTTDNPRNEHIDIINKNIIKGFKKNDYEIILDRKLAINKLIKMMDKDSILLVLGKGVEKYQLIGNEKIPYNDKESIMEENIESPH